MTHILLVEDDIKLANLISEYLHSFEFQVTIETRGDNALSAFNASPFDLVILDLMLPGLDGMSICREIRKKSFVPILILTAKEKLRLLPPLTISYEDIDKGLEILTELLK